jgi:SAM-dependent methyltransferase/uncharacterized protein YbaR (Trm112 family)
MKPQTLELIKCPFCQGTHLTLEPQRWGVLNSTLEMNREVMEGKVICKCGQVFPIREFILCFDHLLSLDGQRKAVQRGNLYQQVNEIYNKPTIGAGHTVIPDLTTQGALTKDYFSLHPIHATCRRVAEVGCGDGYWSTLLTKCGWDVIGIDPSFNALKLAKEAAINQGLNIEYICGTSSSVLFRDGVLDARFQFSNLKPPELNLELTSEPISYHLSAANVNPDFACGVIWKGRSIGQVFRSPHNIFRSIDVMMATYDRLNKGRIIFHLRAKGAKKDLVTIPFLAQHIKDNAFKRFSFPPIRNARGKVFYFFFTSPQPTQKQGITAWATRMRPMPGPLTINHRRQPGALVYRIV